MKKLLNTIYITRQDSYLYKKGETLCISCDGELLGRLPIHTIEALVLFGVVSCSPFLLGFCAENGVSVTWLGRTGRFLGSLQGPVSGNVLLRKKQYHLHDDMDFCQNLSQNFVAGKIYNSRTVLRRAFRNEENTEINMACTRLGDALERTKKAKNLDELRGIEGEAARVYFSVFNKLILVDDEDFLFNGRNKRPPLDPVNCLLSFTYTLLTHDIRSALESVGLDPAVGYLHRIRPGRPSLALDLMEEFRPYLADRLVLTLINRKQLKPKDFKKQRSGAVLLKDDARKTLLEAWQTRKRDKVLHSYLEEEMELGLFFFAQARLLAQHIRGDLPEYPPVVIR